MFTSVMYATCHRVLSTAGAHLVSLLLKGLLFVRGLEFLAARLPQSLDSLLHGFHVGDELADRGDGAQELRVELDTAASVETKSCDHHVTLMCSISIIKI